MEAVKIDIYISDLLYSYDCVIVPEFGGFVANYAPAKIKEVQHQFLPPSKQISFNKNLKNNDGLLTNHISQRREISFQEANKLIRAFVDKSLTGLKNGDKIKIDKVGELYLDPEGNIQFNEEEQNDFLLDSFGLQSFRALPVARDTVENRIQEKLSSVKAYKAMEKEKKEKKEKQSNTFIWKAVAGVVLLVAAGFLLTMQYDKGTFDDLELGFLSPSVDAESTYEKSEAKEFDQSETTLAASPDFEKREAFRYTPVEGETTNIWVEEDKRIDNTKVATSAKSSGSFHVMGGCFAQENNAKKLQSSLQSLGYSSQILGKFKNLTAVSYASFSNREDAVRMLRKVQNEHNPKAWILERNF
ncbi:MAG: hypothetical protein CMP59_08265 [Flavobacteriales bacterium]|nr:hypothetical protein [Flavobacteriales bacterium]